MANETPTLYVRKFNDNLQLLTQQMDIRMGFHKESSDNVLPMPEVDTELYYEEDDFDRTRGKY